MSENDSAKKQSIQVKYSEHQALYASQALVQGTREEVFIDFSAGLVADGQGGNVLPIHTRIAMTPAGAERLRAALNQSLGKDVASS
ncbi:DUF3467 domain-containing protein [Coraliomargarita akajimensis]|uniref:DUF3467 domain-containing protein n=1 Tax=Coraliomargarita akajimensis (strain DSM 45221 / IAM 15411 / JCM 23193 / KCTC 12865 / 04OKA010-24) TaxID=583355 RepID=D5EP90_CORAD|nr:DUF3467 domain-containing protein [Coraliomargarita akajimensis]ADE55600.1 hypothetical protein Caka_2584 [Coraliomargarita akajimensis DSM 45221]